MINDSYDIFLQRRKRRWVPYRMMASKDTYSGSIRVFVEKDTCTVYWSHRFCFFGYMFNCWNKFLADVGLLNANWAESNRWVSTLPRIWSLCPTPMRINLTWMETKKSPPRNWKKLCQNPHHIQSIDHRNYYPHHVQSIHYRNSSLCSIETYWRNLHILSPSFCACP